MFCRNCGKPIDENAWVCMHCGVRVGQTDRNHKLIVNYCHQCGAAITEYQSICVKCGNLVRGHAPQPIETTADEVDEPADDEVVTTPRPKQSSKKINTVGAAYKERWRFTTKPPVSRYVYWTAALLDFLITSGAEMILFGLLAIFSFSPMMVTTLALIIFALNLIYCIIAIISGICFGVRRLHDAGYSGAAFFLILVPIVGPIVLFCLLCVATKTEDNPYI